MDVVLKDSDQQHDAEAQQHAGVLQQEEATVTEAVVTGVVVQHLGHLRWTGSGEFRYSGPTCTFFFLSLIKIIYIYHCFDSLMCNSVEHSSATRGKQRQQT